MDQKQETITVHQLANKVREETINRIGERGFAITLLEISESLEHLTGPAKFRMVLELYSATRGLKFQNYLLIWLDGNGYGELSTKDLEAELEKIKKEEGQIGSSVIGKTA